MAAKGQLKKPEDMHKAIRRALKMYERSEWQIAFFLIGGVLSSCTNESPDYLRRVDLFESSLIGVYDIASDARYIKDDIEEYYKQFETLPGLLASVEIPVFRSSGRRIKQ